jgi:alkylhydroperoxidase/carboxymuconolactone decarboxylase family protein YurZ
VAPTIQNKANNFSPIHPSAGPWDWSLDKLREWDPVWAEICVKMAANPSAKGALPRKAAELIGVAVNAACANLNPDGTRRHIRAALEAGATRQDILVVLRAASLVAIHSGSFAAPTLLEEANAAGLGPDHERGAEPAPACDKLPKTFMEGEKC